jgi:hypothetical protein
VAGVHRRDSRRSPTATGRFVGEPLLTVARPVRVDAAHDRGPVPVSQAPRNPPGAVHPRQRTGMQGGAGRCGSRPGLTSRKSRHRCSPGPAPRPRRRGLRCGGGASAQSPGESMPSSVGDQSAWHRVQ